LDDLVVDYREDQGVEVGQRLDAPEADQDKDLHLPPSYIPNYLAKVIGAQAKYEDELMIVMIEV
jgi:hypothetical protein